MLAKRESRKLEPVESEFFFDKGLRYSNSEMIKRNTIGHLRTLFYFIEDFPQTRGLQVLYSRRPEATRASRNELIKSTISSSVVTLELWRSCRIKKLWPCSTLHSI